MSGGGRGGYRGRGRGGHGYGGRSNCGSGQRNCRSNNDNSGNNRNCNEDERKKVFEPHFAGKQHVDACDLAKEQTVTQTQKSFKEQNKMTERIREEDESPGEPTKPELGKANFFDTSGKAFKGKEEMDARLEQEECDMMFCEELRIHNEEKKQLEDNMQKACALIVKNHCSHLMKT